jgi:hypothetical protein
MTTPTADRMSREELRDLYADMRPWFRGIKTRITAERALHGLRILAQVVADRDAEACHVVRYPNFSTLSVQVDSDIPVRERVHGNKTEIFETFTPSKVKRIRRAEEKVFYRLICC